MPTPNSRKRKRQTITLEEKQLIIEASKAKLKVSDLVTHFNDKYRTIDNIVKSKDKIEKAIDDGAGGKRATLKGAKNSNLEEALLKWLKDVRSENVAVDGPTLKAKAIKLAELQAPPPVSRQQAYQGFDQLRRYVEENATDPKAMQHCHYFEDFLHQEQAKHSVQAPITQFFN